MKHPEGLRVSLVEEGMLDGSGVLKGAEGTSAAYGLTDNAIQLFLLVAVAGEDGIAQNKLPRELRDKLDEAMLPLEMQNLVEWQRDNRGRKAYIVLTWRGKEALDAAKTKPTSAESWATRRRAAVTPAGASLPRQEPVQAVAAPSPRRAPFVAVPDEPMVMQAAAGTPAPAVPFGEPVEAADSFFAALDAPSVPGTRRAATRRRTFGGSSDADLSALAGVGAELNDFFG